MKVRDLLKKNYIPCHKYMKESFVNFSKGDADNDWIPIDKVPIRKIKKDESRFEYPNRVSDDEVYYMINNFYKASWEPIWVDEDFYLIDGQHRLSLAKKIGLKYIDVIMTKKKAPRERNRIIKKLQIQRKLDKIFAKFIH